MRGMVEAAEGAVGAQRRAPRHPGGPATGDRVGKVVQAAGAGGGEVRVGCPGQSRRDDGEGDKEAALVDLACRARDPDGLLVMPPFTGREAPGPGWSVLLIICSARS